MRWNVRLLKEVVHELPLFSMVNAQIFTGLIRERKRFVTGLKMYENFCKEQVLHHE